MDFGCDAGAEPRFAAGQNVLCTSDFGGLRQHGNTVYVRQSDPRSCF
jgi:hypothetical protein